MQLVRCPQCYPGRDEFCPYCEGTGEVSRLAAREWQQQNKPEPGDKWLRNYANLASLLGSDFLDHDHSMDG